LDHFSTELGQVSDFFWEGCVVSVHVFSNTLVRVEQKVLDENFNIFAKRGKYAYTYWLLHRAKYKSLFIFFFSRWPRDVSPCVSPHNFPRLRWRTYTFSQSRSFRSAFQWKLSVLLSRERRVFSGCRLWKWIKCTPRARKIIRPPYRQFRCYMIKYIANASGAMNRIIQKNISSA